MSYKKSLKILRMCSMVLMLALVVSCANGTISFADYEGVETERYLYFDSFFGDDNNDGLSESTPRKSLSNLELQAGDHVMLKRGSVWNGQLYISAKGTPHHPIVVDAYGSGSLPIINGQGQVEAALLVYNSEYVEVNNVELTNKSETKGMFLGASCYAEDMGAVHHIYFNKLYVHDVSGLYEEKRCGGIGFTIGGKTVPTYFDDIRVTNCKIKNVDRTGIFTYSYWRKRPDDKTDFGDFYPMLNVLVRNNILSSIGGDGICIRDSKAPLIEYNIADNCNSRAGTVNVAMWPFNCDDAVMQYNESYLTRTTLDGFGFDSDWNCNDTIIQYNYSHDNEGGFVLICCNGHVQSPGAFNNGTIVRYNISQNDQNKIIELTGPTKDVQIYNNVFAADGCFTFVSPMNVLENDGQAPDNIRIFNNIFYNEGMIGHKLGNATNVTYENNCYYSVDDTRYKEVERPYDKNPIFVDPQFVNPLKGKVGLSTLGGYKLKKTSPLINWGLEHPEEGVKDFWNNEMNGKPDIGVSEYQGATLPKIIFNNVPLSIKNAPVMKRKKLFGAADDVKKAMKFNYKIKGEKLVVTKAKGKKLSISKKSGNFFTKKQGGKKKVYVNLQYLCKKLGLKYTFSKDLYAGKISRK